MTRPSFIQVPACGWMLASAMSLAASAQAQSPSAMAVESNSVQTAPSERFFRVFGADSPPMAEMAARYKDPAQRARLLEEQRRYIVDAHYGVPEALELDAATYNKLVDLQAQEQIEQSEYFYRQFGPYESRPDPGKRPSEEVERANRYIDAQRELLGQEKLERLQQLRRSVGHRAEVRQFDERLGAADKLTTTQRERLIELLHDHLTSSIQREHLSGFGRSFFNPRTGELPSSEELQRQSQLSTIAANEKIWREAPQSNRELRERAAEFLAPAQLAVLEQIHAERLATLQRGIEQMRIQAGLSPTIPAQPQTIETAPEPVEREVRLSLKVAVNDLSPRYLTTTVNSGKPVSLKIADSLLLEATPILFDDDSYTLRLEYYETGITGKRCIESMRLSGTLAQPSGVGSAVVVGNKGYAIDWSVRLEST